jgi:hypothetical protein
MFDNFSLMRTQKINDISELLKIYKEDELLVQDKLNGTLGLYYKENNESHFRTRIGIQFKDVQIMNEEIPNNTVFLAIMSQDNNATVIDVLVYDEKNMFSSPLIKRIEILKEISKKINVQVFKSFDCFNRRSIIKPKSSTYKLSNNKSSETNGDWFTFIDNRHDIILGSTYINNNKRYFRGFQLIEGRNRKVCNITIEDKHIENKITRVITDNKRSVVTITGDHNGEKILNAKFASIKKNKPFNSVNRTADRLFETFEVFVIGKKRSRKVISKLNNTFSTQQGRIS